jgi:isopenicillin N synthase-like dioxygenase
MSKQSAVPIPVVNLSDVEQGETPSRLVAEEMGRACRESGFFYVAGHGVSEELCRRLDALSRRFFGQDLTTKLVIGMERGGRAWRGYFPVGAELTSGRPDQKEGLYFGTELPADHPMVQAGVPLHGANLFPDLTGFRETVLDYIDAVTRLGQQLMQVLAMSLGLSPTYFANRYTREPLILFRIFHYPPASARDSIEPQWGVGEHTDYGLLTILRQDDNGGLQIKSPNGWIEAPPIPETFVCNIGDMLDRMTGGHYRSTPHRVKNRGEKGRLSFPFFFDPNWEAQVQPIDPTREIVDDRHERWDRASVHDFSGTYGEYVLRKVAKVFPDLAREKTQSALDDRTPPPEH